MHLLDRDVSEHLHHRSRVCEYSRRRRDRHDQRTSIHLDAVSVSGSMSKAAVELQRLAVVVERQSRRDVCSWADLRLQSQSPSYESVEVVVAG